jgi:hypothetical protein
VSHEITNGSILGGRYLVTGEVVSTEEGDIVFDGTDQVLNRAVSILVAAPINATRVAVSAREVAMGTRPSNVQVLDLGLQGDSTYLITNMVDATDLLDLAVESDAPYIEPFQTDTLGQEIFGESRPMEPQVYGDDAEYYEELAQESSKRRLFGRRKRKGDVDPTPATAENEIPPNVSPDQAHADVGPATGPFASQPVAASEAAKAYPNSDSSQESEDKANSGTPAVTPLPNDDAVADDDQDGSADDNGSGGAGAAGPASSGSSSPSRFPREAAAAAATIPPANTDFVAASGTDEGGHKLVRLIVGLVLVVVLVVGVVFAVRFLGKPADKHPAAGAHSTQAAKPTQSGKPSFAMNSNDDSDLPNAVDGNSSTKYKTYSYKSAVFGGFTQQMVLAIELKQDADVSSVDLSGLNGTGGKVQILVGDTDNPEDAQERYSGSFSGPSLSADLGSGSSSAKSKYVFVSITELPRLATATGTYPYGFEVGEIQVK